MKEEMHKLAAEATQAYLDKYGDMYPCGFAWVEIYPEHKGNTVLGKQERVKIRELGFELDYTGKVFSLWNPSKNSTQNIDAKYAGAVAAATFLKSKGFKAYAMERLD